MRIARSAPREVARGAASAAWSALRAGWPKDDRARSVGGPMGGKTLREGHIEVTGGRVWHHQEGEGPGLPLLTLHGGPGAGSEYLKALLALADERPVILYDQLGGG